MTDLLVFHPLACLLASLTGLLLVALTLSSRRTRRILRALLILSPGTPLFLAAGLLTVARMLVWWLTSKMPNAASMTRAALDLQDALNTPTEEPRHEPVFDQARCKILRFPQR